MAGSKIDRSGDVNTDHGEEGIGSRPEVPGICKNRVFAAGEVFEVVITSDLRSRRLI